MIESENFAGEEDQQLIQTCNLILIDKENGMSERSRGFPRVNMGT